jgi:hypothetical protein
MELHPLLLSPVVGETEIAIRLFTTKKNGRFRWLMQKGQTICSTLRLSKILIFLRQNHHRLRRFPPFIANWGIEGSDFTCTFYAGRMSTGCSSVYSIMEKRKQFWKIMASCATSVRLSTVETVNVAVSGKSIGLTDRWCLQCFFPPISGRPGWVFPKKKTDLKS